MGVGIKEFKTRAKSYLDTRNLYIRDDDYQDIQTETSIHGQDKIAAIELNGSSWWLIGGATPLTLNKQDRFRNAEEAYLFHIGVTSRLLERQSNETAQSLDSEIRHAFINHASEDKADFVKPLYDKLSEMGLYVWYDENELRAGQSLRRSIGSALQKNAYGISILSNVYFSKNWAQEELDILVDQQITEGRVNIIPVWYDVSHEEVRRHNPTLANRKAIKGDDDSISKVAEHIFEDIVEDAKNEARSLLTLDNSIERNTGRETNDGKNVADILASHNMPSHTIHYFDNRYVGGEKMNSTQLSELVNELSEASDVLHLTNDRTSPPNDISDSDYLVIQAQIRRTPLNFLNYIADRYNIDKGNEQQDKEFTNQIEKAAKYFKTNSAGNSDGDFIFKLDASCSLRDIDKYVDDRSEHFIFGVVKHVYQNGEKDHFLDVMNDTPGKSRQERTQQRIQLKQVANKINRLRSEKVSESDFYIESPDITLRPIIIYD